MPAYFGLDIGSSSIKIAHIDNKKVNALGIANNTIGKNVMAMSNAERIGLVESIKTLIKDSGLRSKKVVASLPESLVYSRVLKFPFMSTPELATAIKWELDQTVPFPPNEIEVSWVVLSKPDKLRGDEKISVYVVAVPTKVSDIYTNLLELADLEPIRLENEVPPLSRTFSANLSDSAPSIIMNIGASGTGMILAGKEILFGNYYMPVGGNALTRFIADAFNLPMTQAESYKRTYGIAKDQLEGKMFVVLKPIVDNVLSEVKKMIIAYQDEYKGSSVSRIILTGGGSYMNGLLPYVSSNIANIEVVIGDAFSGLNVPEKYKGFGPVFDIANGLSS
jgi:type IV pilus assembly protein PilM